MTKDETVADVLAEMRGVPAFVAWSKRTLADVADRIEAAHKREIAKLSGGKRRESCKNGDSCKTDDGAEADITGHCPKSNGTCPIGNGTCPIGVVTEQKGHKNAPVTAELREWITDSVDPSETDLLADVLAIADRIDEAVDRLRRDMDAMAEHGWVRLPVDADGEYIHVGDMLTYDGSDPGDCDRLTLREDGWTVSPWSGDGWSPEDCCHAKPTPPSSSPLDAVRRRFRARNDEDDALYYRRVTGHGFKAGTGLLDDYPSVAMAAIDACEEAMRDERSSDDN